MEVENLEQETETNQPEVKPDGAAPKGRKSVRIRKKDGDEGAKRRCVSTACIGTLRTLSIV